MSEPRKRKGIQKYLADFRPGEDGRYDYRGTYHVCECEVSLFKGHLGTDALCILVCCCCWLFCGLLPKAAMNDSVFIVVPWLLQALAVILCVMSPVRRSIERGRLRTYMYKRYIVNLVPKSVFLLICGCVCTISQIIYTSVTASDSRTGYALLYAAAEAAASVFSLILLLSARKEVPMWHEEK